MPPALDHAITFPSVSVIVMCVLLNEAWMCTRPWWTTRFSPRFLNVFFFLPASPFFSGTAPGAAASLLAIFCSGGSTEQDPPYVLLGVGLPSGHRALARPLSCPGVRTRALATHRQIPAVPQAAVAADLHQPLDVHRDLLAEVSLDAAHLLDHPADLPD